MLQCSNEMTECSVLWPVSLAVVMVALRSKFNPVAELGRKTFPVPILHFFRSPTGLVLIQNWVKNENPLQVAVTNGDDFYIFY